MKSNLPMPGKPEGPATYCVHLSTLHSQISVQSRCAPGPECCQALHRRDFALDRKTPLPSCSPHVHRRTLTGEGLMEQTGMSMDTMAPGEQEQQYRAL